MTSATDYNEIKTAIPKDKNLLQRIKKATEVGIILIIVLVLMALCFFMTCVLIVMSCWMCHAKKRRKNGKEYKSPNTRNKRNTVISRSHTTTAPSKPNKMKRHSYDDETNGEENEFIEMSVSEKMRNHVIVTTNMILEHISNSPSGDDTESETERNLMIGGILDVDDGRDWRERNRIYSKQWNGTPEIDVTPKTIISTLETNHEYGQENINFVLGQILHGNDDTMSNNLPHMD